MLDKEIFEWWLAISLAFANQDDNTPDAVAEVLLRLRRDSHDLITEWHQYWVPPAVGYKKLRCDWKRNLAGGVNRDRFRVWCKKNSTGLKGPVLFLYEKDDFDPLYDAPRGVTWEARSLTRAPRGRVITYVNRPEVLLAHVGLKLLGAEPAFRVLQCSCKTFSQLHKAVGKPPKFCPACREAKRRPSDLSRVRKCRGFTTPDTPTLHCR